MGDQNNLALGIDIGTTSVKVCIVNTDTNEIIAKHGKDTQASVPSDQGTDGNKQDVPKIISALNTCVAKLNKDLLRQIKKIGVCGQMHGVMLFNHTNESPAWERHERDGTLIRYDVVQKNVSHLYTWQDSRCDGEFMANLPTAQSHLSTYSGYGVATLFWMAKNKPEKLQRFNCASTIQDYAVMILCNLGKPITSVQLAASWGYFDCKSNCWNTTQLEAGGFPTHLLPDVFECGQVAGELADNWHTIPKGTPVGVALGDLQCSVLSTIENCKDAVLNISTSAQMTYIAENFEATNGPPVVRPIEYFPYFAGKYLAVAASLNGGNALATFVKTLQQWCMELGFPVPQAKVWDKLMELASTAETDMVIQPTLLGERFMPELTASVNNITIGNIGLGQVFRSMCQGLLHNLHGMMPRDTLIAADITRIVGNGSGLSRNKVLQQEVQQLYQLPLVFTSGGDAAKGAAMAMK